jgi:phosphatidylglycerophosphatase C
LTPAVPDRRLAIFDLDGTLSRHDTLLPYVGGLLWRRPWRLVRLPLLLLALIGFSVGWLDRGRLKSVLIRQALGGLTRAVIAEYTRSFAAARIEGHLFADARAVLQRHAAAGDYLVLLSASPDLYVPELAAQLGFHEAICTQVSWRGERLEGALLSANRRGEEKARCVTALREKYRGLPIIAYGNSESDLAHLRLADHGVLVNGTRRARGAARALGVECALWR